MYLSIYLSTYLPTYLPAYLPACLAGWLAGCLSVSLSLSLPVCLSVYLSVYLQAWKRSYSARRPQVLNLTTSKTQQFGETSSIFELDNVKNEAILGDFVIFQSWQHQKRSNSVRLPLYFNLTTSKTKQFCETSKFFQVGNIKNEAILRDFLQKWKVACSADFFQSICLNHCACHEQVMPGHTKCCTCHAKSSQQTWRSQAPKCNPSQEISARTS